MHAINSGRISASDIHSALRSASIHIPRFASGGAMSGAEPLSGGGIGRGGNVVNVNVDTRGQPISRQTRSQIALSVRKGLAMAERYA